MKRRDFIRTIGAATAASPLVFNGLGMRAFGQNAWAKAVGSAPNDNILVLIQLHGGNDGLNTFVPIPSYGTYASLRPGLTIPESGSRRYIDLDTTLPSADQSGLHPDMGPIKAMYDDGLVSVVRGVGYENTNGSHFRSRDIWFMGGDYDEYKNSGWMGRYLDHVYPNYPDDYPTPAMPDPLGLEINIKVSLGYYRAQGIPTAIATPDPGNFNSIISGLGGPVPDHIPADHYGLELQHIIDLYANANDYAAQLETRYDAGSNNVTYPGPGHLEYPGTAPSRFTENPLGPQLETIARLIHGGSKTKIYLVRLEGFDTHDSQVPDGSSPTEGIHGALLYHLSNAVKAFFDDLAASGMDEKVLAMTFTDFGRRPFANGSLGTDHGSSSPTMLFGPAVNAGVIGTNPSLTDLDSTGNLLVQHDYRQVLTGVLCDWLGADLATLEAVEFDMFADSKLDVVDISTVGIERVAAGLDLQVSPNPVRGDARLTVRAEHATPVAWQIIDPQGRVLFDGCRSLLAGRNDWSLPTADLPAGTYHVRVVVGDRAARTTGLVKQ